MLIRTAAAAGPFNIPLLGSWEFIKLYLCDGDMARMYERLGARYGPVVFLRVAMDTPVVAIRTNETIKASREEASKDLQLGAIGGSYLYRQMSAWHNLGLSFAEGKNWHDNRRFTINTLGKLGFTRRKIEPLVAYECAMTAQKLTEAAGQPVDSHQILPAAALNSILQLLMSRRFELDDHQVLRMRSDSVTLFSIMAKIQTYLDFAPWLNKLAGKDSVSKELDRVMDTFYEFVDQVIAEHEETFNEDEEPRDLLDAYLAARSQGRTDQDLSRANLRVLMKDLIVGGLEGPYTTLSWLLLLLAEHRDVQQRVQDELDAVVGADRTPTIEDQHACPLTLAAIDETLRYATLTPFNRHFAAAGGATLQGYHIPAGSVILVDINSLHHDPDVWGDPDVFRPDRFLGEEGARLRPPGAWLRPEPALLSGGALQSHHAVPVRGGAAAEDDAAPAGRPAAYDRRPRATRSPCNPVRPW
ncbi:Farnesoate epoxidase [Amphibalanus amphitrite]|uniref:Farnesoate epoxidase n=1 Tax=Amphibalanus amphitrite TaxID=1232801 RepID=A0A6A4XF91_AMPAM|nr:Farnesoate epoxidase [Amphibalanus amphitrite]